MKLERRAVVFFGLIFLFTGMSFTLNQKKYEIKTIVIDPGHGGHDVGCLGASAKEKDIALDISLKLGKLLQENYPNIKVIFTRKKDEFIELHERAEIANRNKADLFICVHANSGGGAYGTETFVLGLHRAEENLSVSKRENSAILMEKDYKTKYDGYDPNSPEANIIFRLHQNTYLQQSLLFAAKVQDQLNDYAGRLNRGVKQAGLLVLARTAMPGVLIETGFLTNRNEERYLQSVKGQNQIATAIFRAFKEYKIDMEEIPENVKPNFFKGDTTPSVEGKQAKDSSFKPDQQTDKINKRVVTDMEKKTEEKENQNVDNSPPPNKDQVNSGIKPKPETPPQEEDAKSNVVSSTLSKTETKEKNTVYNTDSSIIAVPKQPKQKADKIAVKEERKEAANPSKVFFTVQLGAVSKPTANDRERYKKIDNIQERLSEDGMTRFTTGTFSSLDKAILTQQEMRGKGFKDAFVTAYINTKRITIKEALILANQR